VLQASPAWQQDAVFIFLFFPPVAGKVLVLDALAYWEEAIAEGLEITITKGPKMVLSCSILIVNQNCLLTPPLLSVGALLLFGKAMERWYFRTDNSLWQKEAISIAWRVNHGQG
jgi:hypothetical protein